MAASAKSLEEDLSCSICCDVFREPVLLGCGHSFCRECLSRHWSSSQGRLCPVCRRPSPREPVPNISLRSTCESFQQQQQQKASGEAHQRRKKVEEKEEEKGERLCLQHNQRLKFYCETEEKLICLQCKKGEHRGHLVLSVQKAVKQRKESLTTASKLLRERLNVLRKESAATEHIKAVVEMCERQVRQDFAKFFAFLQEEQRAQLEALCDAGISETQLAREAFKTEASLLSDQVQEVDEMVQRDDITFLQEFKDFNIMMSTQFYQAMPDVRRQLGNLRFNVWKKMKEVAPYYPVIFDSKTPICGINVSTELSIMAIPVLDPSSPQPKLFAFVKSSKALTDDCHVWNVHISDYSDWVVGVTSNQHIGRDSLVFAPCCKYWGIQRIREQYLALTCPPSPLKIASTSPLKVLRVKLTWDVGRHGCSLGCRVRKLTFSDAQDARGSAIFSSLLPHHTGALYPFLFPCGQGAKLSLEPAEVRVKVREVLGFWERYRYEVIIFALLILAIFVMLAYLSS
ncbi:E3 ubiquitin-protein ligase TRIM35-like [Alosa sapidissima]|uniref:E3 ubiquitin-protein ligase TRIM35-like n=1 Tax=Alosa sapidissima TaxID=34773 RepID=UPI001C09E889|nr:E3 ubiquitin-protein ligase TRIM35-like [Alosa sapidissima]XP_041958823.1 E3 ubiquitin-protein ligase TRIM35-like [Alosa sapidissima]